MSGFKIEWDGLKELQAEMRSAPKRFNKLLIKELNNIGLTTEKYAKGLVSYDSGELEDSIFSTKAKSYGNMYVVYVGTNMEYARYIHELYNPTGRGDKYERGVKYPNYYIGGRGKRTRDKPKVKGYTPGRKYLRNAVVLTEPDIEEAMERVLISLLEGR